MTAYLRELRPSEALVASFSVLAVAFTDCLLRKAVLQNLTLIGEVKILYAILLPFLTAAVFISTSQKGEMRWEWRKRWLYVIGGLFIMGGLVSLPYLIAKLEANSYGRVRFVYIAMHSGVLGRAFIWGLTFYAAALSIWMSFFVTTRAIIDKEH